MKPKGRIVILGVVVSVLLGQRPSLAQCIPTPHLCVLGTSGVRFCTHRPQDYRFGGDQCFSNHSTCAGTSYCQGGTISHGGLFTRNGALPCTEDVPEGRTLTVGERMVLVPTFPGK